MRAFLLTVSAGILSAGLIGTAMADTYVRGYYRNDGTYVQPHYRSSPDRSYNNNWSVRPNVNPYTGQQGTRSPTYDNLPPTKLPSIDTGRPSRYGRDNYRP